MFHMYSVLYPVIHTTLPRMQIVQNHDMDKPCVSLLPDLTRLGTEYERVVGVAKPGATYPRRRLDLLQSECQDSSKVKV